VRATEHLVPFLYSKRTPGTAAARSLVSRYGRSIVLLPLRVNHSWNYPREIHSYTVLYTPRRAGRPEPDLRSSHFARAARAPPFILRLFANFFKFIVTN
jgi:hypothetical protein